MQVSNVNFREIVHLIHEDIRHILIISYSSHHLKISDYKSMVCISFHESVKSLSSNLMRMEIFDIILIIGIILKCSISIFILLGLTKEKFNFSMSCTSLWSMFFFQLWVIFSHGTFLLQISQQYKLQYHLVSKKILVGNFMSVQI